jgi:hypothetical protein
MREYLNDHEMTALEQDEHPMVQRLASVIRGLSQALLLQRMQFLGIKYLGNADAPGLDIALWKAVVEAPVRLSDEEAAELEQVSQQAGGWWQLGAEALFLDFESWDAYYADASKTVM